MFLIYTLYTLNNYRPGMRNDIYIGRKGGAVEKKSFLGKSVLYNSKGSIDAF
jgi:hypothetical protein